MIELRLNAFTVVRVYSDEVGIPGYTAAQTFSGSTAATGTGGAARKLIVEVAARPGHPSSYGLLGLAFEPGGDQLRLGVLCSSADGCTWLQSLAGGLDDVRPGLPRELASAVLEVLTSESTGRFPPGSIQVVRAAHGRVGSSARFFRRLARAAVRLLAAEGLDLGSMAAETEIRRAWRLDEDTGAGR